MRVKKWSKGHELQHTFTMTVDNVPDAEAQEVLVDVVEAALSLDSELTVQRYESRLSKSKELEIRSRLLQEAIADARGNAQVVSQAAGLTLGPARRVVVGLNAGLLTQAGSFLQHRSLEVESEARARI